MRLMFSIFLYAFGLLYSKIPCRTYLNDVENNVLVETVQDALGDTIVVPGSVDKQQILQVFELRWREEMMN